MRVFRGWSLIFHTLNRDVLWLGAPVVHRSAGRGAKAIRLVNPNRLSAGRGRMDLPWLCRDPSVDTVLLLRRRRPLLPLDSTQQISAYDMLSALSRGGMQSLVAT